VTTRWHAVTGRWRRGDSETSEPVDHKPVMGASTPPPFLTAWRDLENMVGDLLVRRSFNGNFPSTIQTSAASIDLGTARWSVYSFKPDVNAFARGDLDGRMNTFLDSIPDGHKTTLIAWHEPEDNIARGQFSLSAFIDMQVRLADLIHATGRPELTHGIVLMGWTLDPRSGRDAESYYPPAVSSRVDYMGWDVYNPYHPEEGRTNWVRWTEEDAAPKIISMARARSKQVMLAEYGTAEHETNPALKPEYLAAVYRWACDNSEVAALTYFQNTQGGNNTGPVDTRPIDSSQASIDEFAAEVEDSKL